MRRLTVSLIAAASLVLAASTWAENVTWRDHFELWNNCKPVKLVVEDLHKDAVDIRLTEEAVAIGVRSRLRAARLYDASALSSYLHVDVGVKDLAFSIVFRYNKFMMDIASGERGITSSWLRGSIGTHGRDSGYILSAVSQHTDEFIDEYLRVNEDACTR